MAKVVLQEPILSSTHGAGCLVLKETDNKQYIVELSFDDFSEHLWSYDSKHKAVLKFKEICSVYK